VRKLHDQDWTAVARVSGTKGIQVGRNSETLTVSVDEAERFREIEETVREFG
jgi:hypothetical protein